MDPEKFYYSKWTAWYPFGYIAIVRLQYYYNTKLRGPGYKHVWTDWDIAFLGVFLLFIIHHTIKYLLPMLKGEIFMAIDNDKIDVRYKRKVIYWSDVEEITFSELPISVVLKLYTKKTVRIYLNGVKGDNESIYETIKTQYKRARAIEGDPLIL
ncbi:MAG: hypothetical protein ABI166_11855 [Mucilaginibacter sp.]